MNRHYFEGWYYKHQANGKTLAVIPGRADGGAFIQVITNGNSYHIPYPPSAYCNGKRLQVGKSEFSDKGITMDIRSPELTLTGELRYHSLTPLRSDIMGPFRFFPMECRHGVGSMRHEIEGLVVMNGKPLDFTHGTGYIESDSGRSFPTRYAWIHCNSFDHDCSIMASVALIPFIGLRFWGCVCSVWLEGREYRLATYRGVKILRCGKGVMELVQANLRLRIEVELRQEQALAAPVLGRMDRTIHENVSCPAYFRFSEGNKLLFEEKSEHASYEYAME